MELETYICPGCGTELRIGTYGCPECSPIPKRKRLGETARKSWEQSHHYDSLDLPDDDFDYNGFLEREFSKVPHKKVGIRWYWWVTALLLLLIAVFGGGAL